MPRPNQTARVTWRCALSLRAAFAPTCLAERRLAVHRGLSLGSSVMLKRPPSGA
ncbi:MAG: hypothetical protein MZV70_42725 [Desulfobacterales bacterium]|nr:hypothetical protein [Desulfobacterales bacterium]